MKKHYFIVALACGLSVLPVWGFAEGTAPSVSTKSASEAWNRVLATYVDKSGRVNFHGLQQNLTDLVEYVRHQATRKPGGNRNQRMAASINTYNALAMYGVIKKGIPRDFSSFFKRLRFFKLTKFEIGGKKWSLYDYENKVVRGFGDPRVHFVLNCMSVGCPRLPQVAFSAESIEEQLESATLEFINSEKYVRVVDSEKSVYLSEIFDFYKEDFLSAHGGSLIDYVNRYRMKPIPTHYRIEDISYDWTVNRQP